MVFSSVAEGEGDGGVHDVVEGDGGFIEREENQRELEGDQEALSITSMFD